MLAPAPRDDDAVSGTITLSYSSTRDEHASSAAATCSERSVSTLSAASTCVVCMDSPKDVVLSPCEHSHCCLRCFRRARTRGTCPVCRTAVTAIAVLATGGEVRVEPAVMSLPELDYPAATAPHLSFYLPAPSYDRRVVRRSRAASVSSRPVAQQAESSIRDLPIQRSATLRELRNTGSLGPRPLSPRCSIATSSSVSGSSSSLGSLTAPPLPPAIVVIGHSREHMTMLLQRLRATFPVPPEATDAKSATKDPKLRSLLYVFGMPMRLVLLECPMFSMDTELIARVQRQDPKLVLLCADIFNVSSFESIVRLDLELLDFLRVPCIWVLIKAGRSKDSSRSSSVEDADIRAAKHFVSSSRACYIATVDAIFASHNVRKLGMELHKAVWFDETSSSLPAPSRAMSLFCGRPQRQATSEQSSTTERTTRSSQGFLHTFLAKIW